VIPQAGIRLQELQITAASNGQGPLQLTGSVRSKPGRLQITGEVDPIKPRLNLNIKGQDFQAMDTTDLRIQLSPDLNVSFDQQQLRVDGQVTIPRAFLRPGGDRPGAIRPSGDVVIVSNAQGAAPPPKPPGVAIFAKVRVILGDDVQLETPAFKGRLKGNLLVEETPQLAPRGSGTVEVVAGNYKIFGQDVEIQRGQVLFSNSPLDNPGLDLRVARPLTGNNFGSDAMVGAQVRGTLKQPQLTLLSRPKMSDADILSHLVLGRASQGSGAESALLFKAANALGFGTDTLTRGLGEAFGLDTLEFNPDASGNGSALSLGKFLTPNLYIGYGVGLLDNANTFIVKYRLTQRLSFESNASAAGTGADLTYTLER
jgi:translocation and assembly module TamB